MKTRSVLVLGLLALAAGLLLAPRLVSRLREPVRPVTAAEAPRPLQVEVLEVQPRALRELLSTTGTIRANEQIDLVSEIAGVVRSLHFDEGAPVRQGDLLVKLDDTELQAQRDRVSYRLRLAQGREERQRQLRQEGVISEDDYDIASNERNVLEAELRLVEAQLEKTEIRAPFAGIVGLRSVSAGSRVSPQTRIATLQDVERVKLDFTLPESYAGRIGPGTRVGFQVKGIASRYEAEVYAVEPRIDPETRSLVLRAVTDNPGGRLVPGAFADVTLAVNEVVDALAVPSLAIIPELGGKKVFVVEDGAAQPRRVETGIRSEDEVQVTSGLSPGDRVIVSATQRLRPGLPVEPVAVAASTTPGR